MKIEFNKLRPCIVKSTGQKGLYHGIFQQSYICAPSMLKGGHHGGVVAGVVCFVELEDGSLIKAKPDDIKFLDRIFEEYDFTDERGDGNET